MLRLLNEVSVPNEVLDNAWLHDTIEFVASEGYKMGFADGQDQERFSE